MAVINGFNVALGVLCVALLMAVAALRPYSTHFGNVQSGAASLLAAVCLFVPPDTPAVAVLTWTQSVIGFLPLILPLLMMLPWSKDASRLFRGKYEAAAVSMELLMLEPLQLIATDRITSTPQGATHSHRPSPCRMTSQERLAAIVETICALKATRNV